MDAWSRRIFLRNSGLFVLGSGLLPAWAAGAPPLAKTNSKNVFVFVFLRGAMDGLSLLVPYGDPYYASLRPNILLGKPGDEKPLVLDGHFALHPAVVGLKELWDQGQLAFVPMSGAPDRSRSHFDSQDFIESGTPGNKNTHEGFLNRVLQTLHPAQSSALNGVALQPSMPRILQGAFPAVSMASLKDYELRGGKNSGAQSFEAMYEQAADKVFRGVGDEIFESLKSVQQARDNRGPAATDYPKHALAKRLSDIASLARADIGLQVAVTDMGGWDTHVNQGNYKGQLADRLRELSESLQAFQKDLGPLSGNVITCVMTEFGRTVKENGNRGTDHGHGSVMMVLGSGVRGKRVMGKWQDLKPANLFEERDVPILTDYRLVLGELLTKHLALPSTDKIFPGFQGRRSDWLGLI